MYSCSRFSRIMGNKDPGGASDKVLGIFRTMVLVKELKVLQDRDRAKSTPLILKGRGWRSAELGGSPVYRVPDSQSYTENPVLKKQSIFPRLSDYTALN